MKEIIEIPQELYDKGNTKVVSINGKYPYYFVKDYADKHTFLKSPHGRFTYALGSMSMVQLANSQLSEEELNEEFEIKYIDNETLKFKRIMYYQGPKKAAKEVNKEEKVNRMDYFDDKNKYFYTIDDILERKRIVKTSQMKGSPIGLDVVVGTNDGTLKCGYKKASKYNVMFVTSFRPDDYDNANDILKQCIEMFDDNDYPIFVILPMNGGGSIGYMQDMVRALTPDRAGYETGSIRISEGSEYVIKLLYGSINLDPKTCDARNAMNYREELGDWYKKPVIVDYGNDTIHKMTQPSQLYYSIGMTTKLKKHVRKTNEIVIFVDGFCYSACSMFVKDMRQRGMSTSQNVARDKMSLHVMGQNVATQTPEKI